MGERSLSKSWGLRASGSFFPLPLPRHSFFFLLLSQLSRRTSRGNACNAGYTRPGVFLWDIANHHHHHHHHHRLSRRRHRRRVVVIVIIITTIASTEVKQPRRRWRWQWERQKGSWIWLVKQELCTCSTIFCTFLCRRCTTMTWNLLISRFVWDVNTKQRFSFKSCFNPLDTVL